MRLPTNDEPTQRLVREYREKRERITHDDGVAEVIEAPKHRTYHCPDCDASCTFEAMTLCSNIGECALSKALEAGEITDRRSTDLDPNFPSEFTYVEK